MGSDESGFEVTGLWLGDTVGSDESGFEVTGKRRRSASLILLKRRRGLDEAVPFNTCALAPMAAEVARRMIPVTFMMMMR